MNVSNHGTHNYNGVVQGQGLRGLASWIELSQDKNTMALRDLARQALRDVKFAVRKEKDFSTAIQKMDKSNSAIATQIKELTKDIQRIKELFF